MEKVVSGQRSLTAVPRNRGFFVILANTAALDNTPARRLQGGIDGLGSGFSFDHPRSLRTMALSFRMSSAFPSIRWSIR